MSDQSTTYTNLTSSTLVAEPNSSYLSCTKNSLVPSEPISGSTMGLMMILSTMQYNTSYLPPIYATAASQAGKAAFMQSGGQAFQNKITEFGTKDGTNFAHSVGVTDTELVLLAGAVKTVRDKQLNIKGPKIYFIDTHLTAKENSGSIGIGWKW